MHLTLYLAIALLGGSVNALKSTTTEDYIATESPIAKRNVLNNIGPPVGALVRSSNYRPYSYTESNHSQASFLLRARTTLTQALSLRGFVTLRWS